MKHTDDIVKKNNVKFVISMQNSIKNKHTFFKIKNGEVINNPSVQ